MEPLWWLTRDGDKTCLAMYERHYSCYRYRDGRRRTQFVGPGEKVVLRTGAGDAFFVWRKFIDDSGQTGINCAAFRNESQHRSSDLIRQADAIADCLWPDSRHYTFVDSAAVRSRNPGFCFIMAGWRRCGRTKSGLLIFERPNRKESKVAKRTIKPSKQKKLDEQPGQPASETPESPPAVVAIPEQPVEVKAEPSAADLLDTPPIMPGIPVVDINTTNEQFEQMLSPEPAGDIPQFDPDQPSEWMAKYKWEQELEDAKNDHLEACLQLREAQQLVKAAREREKDALDFYRELHARGPVVAKPVTPPEEQSGTQQPLPGDGLGENENTWRSIVLTELPLDTIKGLGETKRDALLDACPTLGAFVDKQVEAGASGVNTVLPKGIGKAITDPLEEMLLTYLCKWRNENGKAADEAATGTEATETTAAPAAASETASSVPSFTEWELMTEQQQHDWINARAAQISESLSNTPMLAGILTANLTADFQAGSLAYSRGEKVTDCPRIPGDELDQWLAGYFDAAKDDDEVAEMTIDEIAEAVADGLTDALSDEEPSLAVSVASSGTFSLDDLDDI